MDLRSLENKLIVCEGPDETGKSTISNLLVKCLQESGISTVHTFQPGDTAWGVNAAYFRSLCKDARHGLHPVSNLFAFLVDRTEQVDKIVAPALSEGKTVVSDRWWYSTIAYQFYGKELLKNYMLNDKFAFWLNEFASLFVKPDYVFYFKHRDFENKRRKDQNDQFETAADSFKMRVEKAYEDLAISENFITAPQVGTPQEVLEKLLFKINQR